MSEPGKSDPHHVAIIMDGNGRWAKSKGLPRSAGHERGVESLRKVVEAIKDFDVKHLTVFSFSTENWKRPAAEVSSLFNLLRAYVTRDLKRLTSEGVRVRVIGSRIGLPDDILKLIEDAEARTAGNSDFNLNIAFNYGSRQEILAACQSLIDDARNGDLNDEPLTEEDLSKRMWGGELPDPDLLIRTSGEFRISNFMLWQIAYSEMVFVDGYWPDFSKDQLAEAIETYRARNRRYGAVESPTAG